MLFRSLPAIDQKKPDLTVTISQQGKALMFAVARLRPGIRGKSRNQGQTI